MLGTVIIIMVIIVLLIFGVAIGFYMLFKSEVTQFFDEVQGNSIRSIEEQPKVKKKHHKDIEANKHHNKQIEHKIEHKRNVKTPDPKIVANSDQDHKHKERKDKHKAVPQMRVKDRKVKHEVKPKENKLKDNHKEKERHKQKERPKEKEKPEKKAKKITPKKSPPKKTPPKKTPPAPPPPKLPKKKSSADNIPKEAMGTRFGDPAESDSDRVVKKIGTEEFIPGVGHLQSTIPKPVSQIE